VKFVFAGHSVGLFFLLLCLHLTLWNRSSGLFYSWINSCQNCELAVSRTPWVWDQPVINCLPTQENKQNVCGHAAYPECDSEIQTQC